MTVRRFGAVAGTSVHILRNRGGAALLCLAGLVACKADHPAGAVRTTWTYPIAGYEERVLELDECSHPEQGAVQVVDAGWLSGDRKRAPHPLFYASEAGRPAGVFDDDEELARNPGLEDRDLVKLSIAELKLVCQSVAPGVDEVYVVTRRTEDESVHVAEMQCFDVERCSGPSWAPPRCSSVGWKGAGGVRTC